MISYVIETGLILTCLTLVVTRVKDGATKPDNGSWIAGERLKNIYMNHIPLFYSSPSFWLYNIY